MQEADQNLPKIQEKANEIPGKVHDSYTMEGENQIPHKTAETLGTILEKVLRAMKQAWEAMQSCFEARMCAMVAGIIMSIMSGLAVLLCIGALIYIHALTWMGYSLEGYPVFKNDEPITFSSGLSVRILVYAGWVTLILILFSMELFFSTVLAYGASKSKAGHLKLYYIYGICVSVLLWIASIVVYCFSSPWDMAPSRLTFFASIIQTAITVLAFIAYKKFNASPKSYSKIDEDLDQETTTPAPASAKSCFNARLAAMYVGILVSAMSGLLTLACGGRLIILYWQTSLGYNLDEVRHPTKIAYYSDYYYTAFNIDELRRILVVNITFIVAGLVLLLEFCFSTALAVAASKRDVTSLKACFIYGTIKSVVLTIVSVMLFSLVFDQTLGKIGFVTCGVNTLLAVTAWAAWRDLTV